MIDPGKSLPIIHTGSSRVMASVNSGAVQLIFESPDYERMHRCCGAPECFSSHAGEEFAAHLASFLPERLRALSDDGSYVLNFVPQILGGFGSPTEYLLPKAVVDTGFKLVQTHVWVKSNAPPHAPDRRVKNAFEFLWHFAKGPSYYFNKDEIRQPHLYASRDPRKDRYHPLGKDPGNVILPLVDQINSSKDPDDNVIALPKSQDQSLYEHGGKMRPGLASRFIRLLTKPGDIVLDGFTGTGQTGVEALALGRNFVGYELHGDRAELARKRLGLETTPEETPMESRILNVRDCARYTGRSEHSVRALIKQRRIPYGKQGARVYFDRVEIDRWLSESIRWVRPNETPPETHA